MSDPFDRRYHGMGRTAPTPSALTCGTGIINSMAMPDADFPADPYPGAVPPCSYVHIDGHASRLTPDPGTVVGWRVGGTDLDDWLTQHGAPPAAERVPVLSYGSNRCPGKITWLRRELGLPGPVVVLRARTEGVAAVWAYGLRQRDSQRPAVLAAAPGVVEEHAVWLATPEQIAVLDRCEGRDVRFRLARLRTGTVHTEDGGLITQPWCYLGHATIRRPLLVDGTQVRCADVPQSAARNLLGDLAPDDGLDAPTVNGEPHPDEWPAALFAYGLLRPGQSSWPMVAPHVAGAPQPAQVRGTIYDTSLGYPALVPTETGSGPGTLVPLRDPAELLRTLDAYEGTSYQRIRLATLAGAVGWAYAWRLGTAGMRRLPDGWPPTP